MQRMCKACGNWHDLENWPDHCRWEMGARRAKKFGTAAYVISDEMRALKHHGNGEIITSKRQYSKTTRQLGMVEMGNEVPKPRKPIPLDKGQRREEIRKVIYELRNGTRH